MSQWVKWREKMGVVGGGQFLCRFKFLRIIVPKKNIFNHARNSLLKVVLQGLSLLGLVYRDAPVPETVSDSGQKGVHGGWKGYIQQLFSPRHGEGLGRDRCKQLLFLSSWGGSLGHAQVRMSILTTQHPPSPHTSSCLLPLTLSYPSMHIVHKWSIPQYLFWGK